MATVENTRIAQLDNLPAEDIADNDLLIVSDVSGISGVKTKRCTAASYRSYVVNSVYSGSTNVPTSSISVSASFATTAITCVSASSAITSSHSLTGISSSYSATASFALNAIASTGTTLTTGSYYPIDVSRSITGSNANTASHALNLVYNGTPNGTAFLSISSSYSTTSSYVNIGGTINATASWANNVLTSQYSLQSANASTADTAITATRISDTYVLYGPWTGSREYTLSSTESYIRASASIIPNDGDPYAETIFYCVGTVTSSFTSSAANQEPRYIYLGIKNYQTEAVTELDRQYFDFRPFETVGLNLSGSMICGFNLVAPSGSCSGSYKVFISASRGVDIDFNRKPIFTINTKAASLVIDDFPFI